MSVAVAAYRFNDDNEAMRQQSMEISYTVGVMTDVKSNHYKSNPIYAMQDITHRTVSSVIPIPPIKSSQP